MPSSSPDQRPDPDALLARMQKDEARAQRGRLKIFFGASAGVGKTYAMLQAAHQQAAAGIDVVVGYVELHGRAETEALLAGLEILPPQLLEHRGIVLREFDLDAALARKPQLLLVDELAHSNHPGARHAKRWHDVEELRDAGIDVYTTVNVQHVESLNDVVAQITATQVRETVPDGVFESADEVELVDLPPDELLQRLREGRIYTGEKSHQALDRFFRKGNLIALRQLALRATADRVDAAMQEYRSRHAIEKPWHAGERVLVCVGPDPLSQRVVRAARRMAFALHAEWLAVYVETPHLQRLSKVARDRVLRTLKLAQELGAETANLSGESVAAELIAYARQRNVSKIIVGKPLRTRWRDRFSLTLLDELVRQSGHIDVYVISGEAGEQSSVPQRSTTRSSRWPAYVRGLLVVGLATAICSLMVGHFESTNLGMVYLLATVIVAARIGRGPAVMATMLGVLLFDFLFVPPYFSFAVSDSEYVITFAVMLVVGLVISNLTAQGRRQANIARHRERRTAELYELSRELARARDVSSISEILCRHVLASIDGEAVVLLPDGDERLQDPTNFCRRGQARASATVERYPVPGNELGIAQWAHDHREAAGMHTDTLASADAIYLPLAALKRSLGVLALRPQVAQQLEVPEQRHLLESFVSQAAVAAERVQLADAGHASGLEVESERLRNVLLSSISHDFRTPLASIIGSASTLLESAPGQLDEKSRQTLLHTLLSEARRMNRLVGNLLDLTRLSSGKISLKRDWMALDEMIGAVLTRLQSALVERRVRLDLAESLPLVSCDEVLIEQVLVNLIENAIKHTPPQTAIDIGAEVIDAALVVRVRDHGDGLPVGEEMRVFEKFHRINSEGPQSGFGLGLTICKYIIEAHGGTISAHNRNDGGAEFRFTLPISVAAAMPDQRNGDASSVFEDSDSAP